MTYDSQFRSSWVYILTVIGMSMISFIIDIDIISSEEEAAPQRRTSPRRKNAKDKPKPKPKPKAPKKRKKKNKDGKPYADGSVREIDSVL